jgi:multiple sugar transport system substrate-binding protein
MYEAEHPNIDIVYEFVGWGDYWTTTATQAAGGNLPDLMQHDYARLEEYVARDLLLPLDNYVGSGTIDLSDVPDASIQGGRIGGTLYGINLGNNSFAVVLDADAFAQAGIDIPPQDWTWQDFENIALELHDTLGIWGAAPDGHTYNWWRAAYMGYGESIFAADGTRLGYSDDQPFIDLLSMVRRLQEAGAAPTREEELARFTDTGPENAPIVTGEAAMAYYWSNQIVAIQSAAGEDRNLILHTLPRPEGGQSTNYLKPSMFWSITKQAKHPQEAAEFISWFTNSIEANEVLLAERGVPIAAHVQQGLQPLLGKPQQIMFDFVSLVETDSSPIDPPDPAGWGDVSANVYIPEVIDPVMYGLITPEEGAAVLREMGDEILTEAASQ